MHSPWLENKKWQKNQIRSSSKYLMIFYWAFAILWNGISYAALIPNLKLLEKAKEQPEILIFFLFPFIGIFIFYLAIKETRNWMRFGYTPLSLDPFPGSIGGHLGGTLEVNLPYDPHLQAEVVVACVYSYESGTGKNRSRKEKIVWQNEGFCHVQPGISGTRLCFRFDIPNDLPESSVKKISSYHLWRCAISVDVEGPDFNRSFDIPVFKTHQEAKLINDATEEHHLVTDDAEKGIESVSFIKNIPGGIEAYFPFLQRPAMGVSLSVFGFIFASIGIAIYKYESSVLFLLVFGLFGTLIFIAGVYELLKSMRITIKENDVQFERILFHLTLSKRQVKKNEISEIVIDRVGSMQTGAASTIYYKLVGKCKNDKPILLAERLNKRYEAEHLKRFYEMYLFNVDN